LVVSVYIHERIEQVEELARVIAEEEADEPVDSESPEPQQLSAPDPKAASKKVFHAGQVVLGSQQHARKLCDLEASTQDVAFKGFRKCLLTWLKANLPPDKLISDGKPIQLLSDDEVSSNVASLSMVSNLRMTDSRI
jgi:hypothetical protein